MPLVLVGAIAIAAMNLPIEGYVDALKRFGPLYEILDLVQRSAFNFISLYLTVAISYFYSGEMGCGYYERIAAVATSTACFIVSYIGSDGTFNISSFGTLGMLSAMLTAVIASRLFHTLYSAVERRSKTNWGEASDVTKTGIFSIVPFVVCILAFASVILLIRRVTGFSDIASMLSSVQTHIFRAESNNLAQGVLYVIVLHLTWFFGIHGGNVLEKVHESVYAPADTDPNLIISKVFIDTFVLLGGCGATICLLVSLILFAKTRANKLIAFGALFPAIFNINELLLFGLPIVLNPIMFIPFILAPMSGMLIAYGATAIGFLPVIHVEPLNWTTPVFINSYLATGSIRGPIVQLIIIAAGIAIYAPFVKMAEKLRDEYDGPVLRRCEELVEKFGQSHEGSLLSRSDDIGVFSKIILQQLHTDISKKNIVMHYQPQLKDGKTVSVESLLRYEYRNEIVPPMVVVKIAQEGGVYDELTKLIISATVDDILSVAEETQHPLKVSVNITPEQFADRHFIAWVNLTVGVAFTNADPSIRSLASFSLEMRESPVFEQVSLLSDNISKLRTNNISAAIDSFSMQSFSRKCLEEGVFTLVKLSRDIVRDAATNQRNRDAIAAIMKLGEKFGFEVAAKYVDSVDTEKALKQLGVQIMQGDLYSPALSPDDLVEFIEKH
jgi:lactose/cellobiose-specific phosphotransferase system IIC component